MNLAVATRVAENLARELGSATDRIAIAGSVRRRQAEVHDIELLAIPRWEERRRVGGQITLGGEPPVERVNLLARAIEQFQEAGALQVIKPGTHQVIPWELHADGRYWVLWIPARKVKVDLFLASPERWGLLYMIRTGSAEFSQTMLARWKQLTHGGCSRDARLWRPAHREPEDTPEEIDAFRACSVDFLPPEQRTGALAVQRAALGKHAITTPR